MESHSLWEEDQIKSESFPSEEKSQLHWMINTGCISCSLTESKSLAQGRMEVEIQLLDKSPLQASEQAQFSISSAMFCLSRFSREEARGCKP